MRIPEPKALEELRQAPIADVIGIVGPWGANIGRAGDQPYTLQIEFEHWKLSDGGLVHHLISVSKQGPFEEFRSLRGSIEPGHILRARAHVEANALVKPSYALLVEIIGEDDSDAELMAIAQKLREPAVLNDARFGKLTLDRRVKWFEGTTTWCSQPVQLRLKTTDAIDAGPALEAAQLFFAAEQDWNQRMYNYAVLKLFNLSQDWRQAEDEPITEESFRRRLMMSTIVMYPSGKFECWFGADGMFTDHAVRLSGNLSEGPKFAAIEG